MPKNPSLTFPLLAALLSAHCSSPPPQPPPPPPPPTVQPVPSVPQEELSIQGRSQPAGPGQQAFSIFINGERVVDGVLSTKSPRRTFHASYHGHGIVAACALADKVNCEIAIDGEPR